MYIYIYTIFFKNSIKNSNTTKTTNIQDNIFLITCYKVLSKKMILEMNSLKFYIPHILIVIYKKLKNI